MTTAFVQPLRRPVLADLIPGGLVRDITLTAVAAVFLGVMGQIAIPLPFTPVPLSLATFAVLLSGAALGPLRSSVGALIYLLSGLLGVPWFAEHGSGWDFPSFGYIIGYVLAAAFVGIGARRGADRKPVVIAGVMVVGNLVIYAAGVPWLMESIGASFSHALALGVRPFLIGDALKLAAAAALLPAAWKLVRTAESR